VCLCTALLVTVVREYRANSNLAVGKLTVD